MRQDQKLRGGIVDLACRYTVGMRHRSPTVNRSYVNNVTRPSLFVNDVSLLHCVGDDFPI